MLAEREQDDGPLNPWYPDSSCKVFAGFVGSRNFEPFSAPFPTFVKFG